MKLTGLNLKENSTSFFDINPQLIGPPELISAYLLKIHHLAAHTSLI